MNSDKRFLFLLALFRNVRTQLLVLSGLLVVAVASVACAAAEPAQGLSNEQLWSTATDRIERHRKSDAAVTVTDASGKPVQGVSVRIEQTRHAFLFGCNIFRWGRGDTAEEEALYRQRFAELLNYATVPFYWPSYERKQGVTEQPRIDQIARWCQQQGIRTKGHPLAWNYADPPWLPDDADQIRSLQMARIDQCVSHFQGLIDRWDVVNEATHFDRPSFWQRAPKMTRMWQQAGRIPFVVECFHHARQANPDATLLINDYRTDPPYQDVIKQLYEHGKPLFDVIGIQSHMHGGVWPNTKIWEVCERFAQFGVPLHFTETTVVSGRRVRGSARNRSAWPSTPEGERLQAKEVERFYTMVFSHPAVEALTWWDLTDKYAWQGAPAGLIRKDMSPKPAYVRLRELIKGKWWTGPQTLKTDAQGKVRFRGFQGDYRVTIASGSGTPIVRTLQLAKNSPNALSVTIK